MRMSMLAAGCQRYIHVWTNQHGRDSYVLSRDSCVSSDEPVLETLVQHQRRESLCQLLVMVQLIVQVVQALVSALKVGVDTGTQSWQQWSLQRVLHSPPCPPTSGWSTEQRSDRYATRAYLFGYTSTVRPFSMNLLQLCKSTSRRPFISCRPVRTMR